MKLKNAPIPGRFFRQNYSLHLSKSKSNSMKSIYFILAVIIVFAQSCTIQKRQHLPGYHIEWNTNESHSEVQWEKIPGEVSDVAKQHVAPVAEEFTTPTEQEVQTNHSDAVSVSPRGLEEEAAISIQ